MHFRKTESFRRNRSYSVLSASTGLIRVALIADRAVARNIIPARRSQIVCNIFMPITVFYVTS